MIFCLFFETVTFSHSEFTSFCLPILIYFISYNYILDIRHLLARMNKLFSSQKNLLLKLIQKLLCCLGKCSLTSKRNRLLTGHWMAGWPLQTSHCTSCKARSMHRPCMQRHRHFIVMGNIANAVNKAGGPGQWAVYFLKAHARLCGFRSGWLHFCAEIEKFLSLCCHSLLRNLQTTGMSLRCPWKFFIQNVSKQISSYFRLSIFVSFYLLFIILFSQPNLALQPRPPILPTLRNRKLSGKVEPIRNKLLTWSRNWLKTHLPIMLRHSRRN